MIVVVTGYRRSGTSMMMRCLHHSAPTVGAIYMPDMDNLNQPAEDGYIPNPGGLYEVGRGCYLNAEFLRHINQLEGDSAIKILYDGLPCLPVGDWRVLFMVRDEEEILASDERVVKHLRSQGIPENKDHQIPFNVFRPYRQADIDHVMGICEARSDIKLKVINYRDVIEDPLKVFTEIRDWGVPLAPEKAAAEIDPNFYRFRGSEDDSKSWHEGAAAQG